MEPPKPNKSDPSHDGYEIDSQPKPPAPHIPYIPPTPKPPSNSSYSDFEKRSFYAGVGIALACLFTTFGLLVIPVGIGLLIAWAVRDDKSTMRDIVSGFVLTVIACRRAAIKTGFHGGIPD